jgi:hypothetical protein
LWHQNAANGKSRMVKMMYLWISVKWAFLSISSRPFSCEFTVTCFIYRVDEMGILFDGVWYKVEVTCEWISLVEKIKICVLHDFIFASRFSKWEWKLPNMATEWVQLITEAYSEPSLGIVDRPLLKATILKLRNFCGILLPKLNYSGTSAMHPIIQNCLQKARTCLDVVWE